MPLHEAAIKLRLPNARLHDPLNDVGIRRDAPLKNRIRAHTRGSATPSKRKTQMMTRMQTSTTIAVRYGCGIGMYVTTSHSSKPTSASTTMRLKISIGSLLGLRQRARAARQLQWWDIAHGELEHLLDGLDHVLMRQIHVALVLRPSLVGVESERPHPDRWRFTHDKTIEGLDCGDIPQPSPQRLRRRSPWCKRRLSYARASS